MNENYKLIEDAVSWWNVVSPKDGFDRYKGERAELRRCHSTDDVMYLPLYHELLRQTQTDTNNQEKLQSLATAAWVLSWVSGSSEKKFAEQLAQTEPAFQQVRFRRLLESNEWNDLAMQLIRALKFTKQTANAKDLISGILLWKTGNAVKEKWALDYYRNASE